MGESGGRTVVQALRRGLALTEDVSASDTTLLREFRTSRDEAAFAALVRRHGPMVMEVCRRILGQQADADDAFQAVFLLLARKADQISRPELLAPWLHGVALRTAWAARRRLRRQRTLEAPLAEGLQATSAESLEKREILTLLDAEVSRLSEKYRLPVVLCELNGRSRKEVAALLGIPEGTLSSRLAAARQRLADRLSRRGIAVSPSVLTGIFAECPKTAVVSSSLLRATLAAVSSGQVTPSVLQLTQGVLMMLWLQQVKTFTVAAVTFAVGIGLVGHRWIGRDLDSIHAQDKPKPAPRSDRPAKDSPLIGGWRVIRMEVGGQVVPEDRSRPEAMYFTADRAFLKSPEGDQAWIVFASYQVDESRSPKSIDLRVHQEADPAGKTQTLRAIYEIDGDGMKFAFHQEQVDAESTRPTSFDGKDAKLVVLHLKRDRQMQEPEPKRSAEEARRFANRRLSQNNLKQIGLAFHNHHDRYGSFPPSAIYSADEKTPLLSWRVAILPFLGQETLYRQFKLDEPWDSEHNKKLLEKMPAVYGTGTTTHYRVFTGPLTVFDGPRRMNLVGLIDGTSNTILAVEAFDAVPWTKPDELPYDPQKPLPKLGGKPHEDGFNILLCDGSVRFLKNDTPEKLLRALVTAKGTEVIRWPE